MASFIRVTALPDKTVLRINKSSIVRYYDRNNDGRTYCSVWISGAEKPIAVAELASWIDRFMDIDIVDESGDTDANKS